ncbi:MAG: hypothetical protein R3301_16525 [Saprospiraceae bacterium]|nr:hypothetical protein [Saprospiraceae bacterium]
MKYYEVIILLVPALIVFVAIFLILKQFLSNQLKMQMLKQKEEHAQNVVQLKLQAYERLMLFCERVSIQGLLLRIQSPNMSRTDLKSALVLAIQQEFEHNLSQQLYVSEKLWRIIKLAKDQLIEIITHISSKVPSSAPSEEFSKQLILFIESQKTNPIETAKSAIKREASLLLQ